MPPRTLQDSSTPLTEAVFCILAALSRPRHGYAIMQWVEQETEQRVKLGPGTLYGALTMLQERALIEPAPQTMDAGERRKTYILTPEGRKALSNETQRLKAMLELGKKAQMESHP